MTVMSKKVTIIYHKRYMVQMHAQQDFNLHKLMHIFIKVKLRNYLYVLTRFMIYLLPRMFANTYYLLLSHL